MTLLTPIAQPAFSHGRSQPAYGTSKSDREGEQQGGRRSSIAIDYQLFVTQDRMGNCGLRDRIIVSPRRWAGCFLWPARLAAGNAGG